MGYRPAEQVFMKGEWRTMHTATVIVARILNRCQRELLPAAIFSLVLALVTFGTGWLVGKVDPENALLYTFWAGMAYMWGMGKLRYARDGSPTEP